MQRAHCEDTHLDFGGTVREFIKRDVLPHVLDWEEAEIVPRSFFGRAGAQGLLGFQAPKSSGVLACATTGSTRS